MSYELFLLVGIEERCETLSFDGDAKEKAERRIFPSKIGALGSLKSLLPTRGKYGFSRFRVCSVFLRTGMNATKDGGEDGREEGTKQSSGGR